MSCCRGGGRSSTKRMYDAASRSDAPTLQRAVGELAVGLRARDGSTVLDGLRQAGCLKVRFPRPGARTGRRRDAEHVRRYRRRRSAGQCVRSAAGRTRDDCGAGSGTFLSRAAGRSDRHPCVRGSWWPGCRGSGCRRRRSCSTAARWIGAWTSNWPTMRWFLGVEMLVFGRAAMGETVRAGIAARCDSRPSRRTAGFGTMRCGWTAKWRAALQRTGNCRWGARDGNAGACRAGRRSAFDAVRAALPHEAAPAPGTACWSRECSRPTARRCVAGGRCGVAVLRDGRPLPRVWHLLR